MRGPESSAKKGRSGYRTHLLTLALLALGVAAGYLSSRLVNTHAAPADPNPAREKLDLRPGGYFPPGFPLHGSVKLLSQPIVEAGQRTRVRFEYTVGNMAIEPGMSLEIWKHFTSDAEELQTDNPEQPAHFTAEFTAAGVKPHYQTYTNWVQQNSPSVFPYRKTAAIRLEEGRLKEGDKVTFDLGGHRGMRMQYYEERLFNFRVVITRDNKVLGYGGDALMRVIGGPMKKLRVQAPSVVKLGENFPLEVVPLDEWVSLARNHRVLDYRIVGGDVSGGKFIYEQDLEHHVARDVKANAEGVLRIVVETTDGEVRGVSNPIWVERNPLRRIYFGELHQHTYLHDGRGVFRELYLHGRRVGLLDFGAVTPHHMPMSVTGPSFHLEGKRFPSENWPELQKTTKWMNGWEGFVSLLGYEYSVGTDKGGHHNVYYNADEARSTMQLDPEEPDAPIAKMIKTLQFAQVPTLVIPHIGGGPPDWSHPTDQRIERLFEIASVHGVFEESWQKHLENGLRLGAIAAGDTHTSTMGIAYPGLNYVMTNALAGVYSLRKNRQQIWDGLYERRSFGATGNARILLNFDVAGELMGGEISSRMVQEPRLTARVSGTSPLVRVELLKNSKVIHTVTPSRNRGTLLRVAWGDNLYQRRAAVGLRNGEMRAERGKISLRERIHLDQAFESVNQDGDGIRWVTAAISNDRDGFLADISEATGKYLTFKLDDSDTVGLIEVRIPLDQLRKEGYFAFNQKAGPKVKHPYMEKMGVAPAFFLECELVDAQGPLDITVDYLDRQAVKPGDYYYLRMEQLDTNKAWSSPVWVN